MELNESDRQYFESYEDVESHEIMLKDRPRNKAYIRALEFANLQDKVVLDVGTGAAAFLSLVAARCGAKKVYAVEASRMALNAEAIVEHNGYSDVIQVIQGRMEEVTLPEKVDVIVSEWMGFYLLHESMLGSVLAARDRWLKPDGILLPTTAAIYACPVSMSHYYEEKFEFWEDVEGFDLSGLMPLAMTRALSQPCIRVLEPDQLMAVPELVASIDCRTVKPENLAHLEVDLEFKAASEGVLHGMALWFVVDFVTPAGTERLSTSPEAPATHWKQTTILFPQTFSVSKDLTIQAQVGLETNKENPRRYNVTVDIDNPQDGEDEQAMEEDIEAYHMVLQACKDQMGEVEDVDVDEDEDEK